MSEQHLVSTEPWIGQWVADRFGVTLQTDVRQSLRTLEQLVGLALRRNPNRAHLLVSPALGKHVPTDPRTVVGAGLQLGSLVARALDGAPATVLGYAETATGLGHAVAEEIGADYLHSTRRTVPGVAPIGGFEEEHSHATTHLLLPDDPDFLARDDVLVLVDDELSTGRTAMNTIAELHALRPRRRYVVAALVDVRPSQARGDLSTLARDLGAQIDVVALGAGQVMLPGDLIERAAQELQAQRAPASPAVLDGDVLRVPVPWPVTARESGRHGFRSADRRAAHDAARATASALTDRILGDRVLVLGCEELMYAPTLVAADLAERFGDSRSVRLSSTTRSPVHVVDEPGYPIRSRLTFLNHDPAAPGEQLRYAYNVAPAGGAQPYTDIVLIVDEVADSPALTARNGLVSRLAGAAQRVLLAVLPTFVPGGAA